MFCVSKLTQKQGEKMKMRFGKNRKCKQCGEEPVLNVIPFYGLVGLVCRRCNPTRNKLFTSMAKARQYWNRRNKG